MDTLNDKVDENNQLLRKLYCSSDAPMAVPWRETTYFGAAWSSTPQRPGGPSGGGWTRKPYPRTRAEEDAVEALLQLRD